MDNQENKTVPVILVGVEPHTISEVKNVELTLVDDEGLEYSAYHLHGNEISVQLINDRLKILIRRDKER